MIISCGMISYAQPYMGAAAAMYGNKSLAEGSIRDPNHYFLVALDRAANTIGSLHGSICFG
jgi:hypothetical protein